MDHLCRPNAIVLTATEKTTIPNEIFSKKDLHVLHLNVNKNSFHQQSNAPKSGISEY